MERADLSDNLGAFLIVFQTIVMCFLFIGGAFLLEEPVSPFTPAKLFMGGIATVVLLVLWLVPALYLRGPWETRCQKLKGQLSGTALCHYYKAFLYDQWKEICSEPTSPPRNCALPKPCGPLKDHFEKRFNVEYGTHHYWKALSIFILVSGGALIFVLARACMWIGNGLLSFSADVAAGGIIGACIWVAYDQFSRFQSREFTYHDIYWWVFRLIIAVPVALAAAYVIESGEFVPPAAAKTPASGAVSKPGLTAAKPEEPPVSEGKPKPKTPQETQDSHQESTTTKANTAKGAATKGSENKPDQRSDRQRIAIVISMLLGLFPTAALVKFGRRLVSDKLGPQGPAGDTSGNGSELEKLQGVNREQAERFQAVGKRTLLELAYSDPIELTMRTNLDFQYVIDCMSQALLAIYLGDKMQKDDVRTSLRAHGLRGALEAYVLERELQEAEKHVGSLPDSLEKVKDLDVRHRPWAGNFVAIAQVLGLDLHSMRVTLKQIALDPYTIFLGEAWVEIGGIMTPGTDAGTRATERESRPPGTL